MHYTESHCQHFFSLEQMSDIGSGEITAGGTVTFGVYGKSILFVFGIIDINYTVPGIKMSVTGIS